MFKELDKRPVSEVEESISESWGSINKMHDAQVKLRENNESFVFYDGPAFANTVPLKRYIVSTCLKSLLNQRILGLNMRMANV